MNAVIASALVTGVFGVIVTLLTQRSNRKGEAATAALQKQQQELNARVVDREDFETVVDQLRASLADVRAELAQVKKELAAEVRARREAEARANRAEERGSEAERRANEADRRASEAERRASLLESRVSQLEKALEDNNIAIPPVPPASV